MSGGRWDVGVSFLGRMCLGTSPGLRKVMQAERDPKVEAWRSWEFSQDGEQHFVVHCRM